MTKLILAFAATAVIGLHSTSAYSQTDPIQPTPDELALAPLLDLRGGGEATGAAQGTGPTQGGLLNGTLIPSVGNGFKSVSGESSRWAAGIMSSLLINSGPVLANQYPGLTLMIGGIAQQNGGPYGPHKSHQNGLDADVLFVGAKNYDSVLDKDGHVTDRFDYEKNWFYWRLITSQQIRNGKKQGSAVSMILVDPRLKTAICAWAKARESTLDSLDYEVLKTLRPTEGHDDHFHIRLHCSPFYASCLDQGFGAVKKITGCSEFDSGALIAQP